MFHVVSCCFIDLIGAAPYLKQLKSHNSIVGLLNLGGGGAGYSSHMSMWEKPARRCDDQKHFDLIGAAPYLKQLKSHNSIVGLLNLGGWCWL